MFRLATVLLVGSTFLVGCNDGGDTTASSTVKSISFQAETGVEDEFIETIGGLTLTGSCKEEVGGPFLSVGAATDVDDAVISSHFDQKGSDGLGYVFVMPDFDRDYGQWDFLGGAYGQTSSAGTLNFSRPDGGQVSIDFVATADAPQGDCVLGGIATYAP